MKIQENISIQPYLSFKTPTIASELIICRSADDIRKALKEVKKPIFVLGGGSNVLFLSDYTGVIIKNELKGIDVVSESEVDTIIEFGAGENWHESVKWCLTRNYGGVENLALIPGTVGAAPIQNIGAYGVELKDVFVSLKAISRKTGKLVHLSKADCQFAYRNSIFKNQALGEFIICSVQLRLTKKNHPLRTEYGAIQRMLDTQKIRQPSIQDISDAVIALRQSKLPDPEVLGNGGSFFKNPVIPADLFHHLKKSYPEMPSYAVSEDKKKIPAAWLIEKMGWKGRKVRQAGVYEKHALVLVNLKNASGKDIWNLAQKIQSSVQNNFGIQLQPEVNIIDI